MWYSFVENTIHLCIDRIFNQMLLLVLAIIMSIINLKLDYIFTSLHIEVDILSNYNCNTVLIVHKT